jgi:HSP90 family molecular chaperone/class 3 adenylate cyclase
MKEVASGGFEINTKKVLKLLVSSLYGDDPHLTIRELLQNGHDAIQSLNNPQTGEITVRIHPFGEDRHIEIVDTGCGMDLEDIQQRLCVVGESDKLIAARDKPEIIGKFGIGFLSSFIIADRIEVRTRKVGRDGQCYLFKANSEAGYTVEELNHLPFANGTSVKLFLKQGQDYSPGIRDLIYELITTDGMEKVLIDFGYFLGFPVRLAIGDDERGRSITARNLPWQGKQFELEAYKVLFRRDEPLFTHPFREAKDGFEASGIFYFSTEILSRPSARLYSKRLLVNPEDPNLLPEYGGFTYCIVECPTLNLDLSRRGAAQSDPAYKMLRKVVREKFTDAFYKLSSQLPDSLFKLWPSADNRIINALLRVIDEENPKFSEERRIAEQFLIQCGPYMPFNILDQTSGGSGIPIWKSIHELTERQNNDTRTKIVVPFTTSNSPVEKDMLVERYPELIDVGRPEKSHDVLIHRLMTLNDSFDSFELRAVAISQFEPIGSSEQSYWEILAKDAERGVFFPGRAHDVAVERFNPHSTPVMITATTVSGEVMGALREQFHKLAGAAPEQAMLMAQLEQQVDRMGAKGGLITIHINANNDLMKKLADGYNNLVMRKASAQGVMNITWRAIVDYYGVGATRDMLARDRRNMEDLMQNVLDMVGELHKQQEELDQSARELKQLREKVSVLEPGLVENSLSVRDLFVGVIDISNSTRDLMGNPNCSPEDKALFLQQVLHTLATKIDSFARVVGFTGDGIQFCIEPNSQNSRSVGARIQSLPNDLSTVVADDNQLAGLCGQLGVTKVRLRIAVDYGQVFVGLVGRREEALGLPFVRATRLSSEKKLFDQHQVSLLLTEKAYDWGARKNFWTAPQFCLAEESLEVAGLSQPIDVYKPKTK